MTTGIIHNACPVCGGAFAIAAVNSHRRRIARCRECGHMFMQNPPSRRAMRDRFQGEAFFADNYNRQGIFSLEDDAQWAGWLRLRLERLARIVPEAALFSGAPRRVFEVGCLEGRLLAALAGLGHSVCGCDLNAAIVGRGREAFGLDIRAGTVEECGFGRGAYDVVLGYHVLHEVVCPQQALAAWTRLLAPGGIVFLVFPLGDADPGDPFRQHYFSRESVRVLAQTHCRRHRLAVLDNRASGPSHCRLGMLVGFTGGEDAARAR